MGDMPDSKVKFSWDMIFQNNDDNKVMYCLEIIETFVMSDLSFFDPTTVESGLRLSWVKRFLE